MKDKIDCFKCQNFFISWDKKARYGCRVFNFKSNILPALAVEENSKISCQFFVEKNQQNSVNLP